MYISLTLKSYTTDIKRDIRKYRKNVTIKAEKYMVHASDKLECFYEQLNNMYGNGHYNE